MNVPKHPTVRLMTWNIHGAVGRNPRFDLARVVHLIKRHEPDIVALQEVDSRRPREAGTENPFDVLQKALGEHGVGAKSVTTADGDYGQTLISRWPMNNTDICDISYRAREPRRAIHTEIATPFGPLRVVTAHFGLSIRERHSQAKTVLSLIGKADMTTVVLGDFNDWLWAGSVRNRLARILPGHTPHRTFPSACPLFHLDTIYCRPGPALVRSHTDHSARSLSDHLPVIADICMKAAREREKAVERAA
jgi:endonuclease/exonuclease/phosphatase family metal-dependent hydrolase